METPSTVQTSVTPLSVSSSCTPQVTLTAGKVCVGTSPGATLTAKVTYSLGNDDGSLALSATQEAANDGTYTWSWTPIGAGIGSATVVVTARLNGQTATTKMTVNVQA